MTSSHLCRAARHGLTAFALLITLPAGLAAADAPSPPTWHWRGTTIRPTLSDRLRLEQVRWFDPGTAGVDPNYGFAANVVRFGAVVQRQQFSLTLEGQDVSLIDIPSDAAGLGPGGSYYANTASEGQHEVHLRRAGLTWNVADVPGLAVEGGRILLNDGAETTPTDVGLAWIKRARVAQRLIGAFDYTHVGRSFDGGTLRYGHGPWNLTLAGGMPTSGGFNVSANQHLGDVHIAYAAVTATEPTWLPRSDLRLFYFYYDDARDVVATDNRVIAERQADDDDIAVHTIGAHFAKVERLGPGDVDLLLWVAGQAGEWESQDHAAWGLAIEGGYRLAELPGKPWLRLGWFRSSGDDDPNDGDHTTFFQGLPTPRIYAQTPFFNLMNNEDLFVQLMLTPWAGANVRLDFHHLRVVEGDDLLYSGGGAMLEEPAFGFNGFAARGHHTIGNFVDLSLDQVFTPHVKAAIYYGHVFGGSVIEAQYSDGDTLDYGYAELTLTL